MATKAALEQRITCLDADMTATLGTIVDRLAALEQRQFDALVKRVDELGAQFAGHGHGSAFVREAIGEPSCGAERRGLVKGGDGD